MNRHHSPRRPSTGAALEVNVGVGTDLCEVSRMARELSRAGAGFRDAVFTAAEVAYCAAKRRPEEHFAARFAAKEAVFKALAAGGGDAAAWREVEVVGGAQGEPEIVLHGAMAARARERGIDTVMISLTHTRELALALAVALPARAGEANERR